MWYFLSENLFPRSQLAVGIGFNEVSSQKAFQIIIIKIINDNKKKRSLEANFIFLKFQEVKLEAEHFNFLKIGLLKCSDFIRNVETLGFAPFINDWEFLTIKKKSESLNIYIWKKYVVTE